MGLRDAAPSFPHKGRDDERHAPSRFRPAAPPARSGCGHRCGATGAVGEELITCLERRGFPLSGLKLLASARSAGKKLKTARGEVAVAELTETAFEGVDLALFSAGGERSRQFAPAAVRAGAIVVDNSSAFRMDPDVPLRRRSHRLAGGLWWRGGGP